MGVEQPRYLPDDEIQAPTTPSVGLNVFETELLDRVKRDFDRAERFRGIRQRQVMDHDRQYNNARYFSEWRLRKDFPLPIARQLVDQLRAQLCDKLFFTGRPVEIKGREDTDKKDADAKQAFNDWQDDEDAILEKLSQAIVDCAVRRFAVATVDYLKTERMEWHEKDGVSVKVPVTDYVGAVVNMLDPQDVYFGPDKRQIDDPFPIMVKVEKTIEYFSSRPFFHNQHLIIEKVGPAPSRQSDQFKNDMVDNPESKSASIQGHTYIEWHGMVNKRDLYNYENQWAATGEDIKPLEDVKPNELTWAIVGVVDQATVVRANEAPLGIDRPSIVIGCLDMDGGVFRPVSIMDKVFPICRAADTACGQMIENIASNVDSAWIINKEALVNKSPLVNKRGFILEANRAPSEVALRLDQIPQTDALTRLIAMYYSMAREAASLPQITLGEGDVNTETLGESAIAEGHGKLGLNYYLSNFVNTFVVPLYEMRNQINMEMIDFPFAFQIIGEQAKEWRIDTKQVRANVNFVCESATREANRAVLIQQMMGLLKLAPDSIGAGFPVRVDRIIEMISEVGMSLTREQVENLLPTIKAERDTKLEINKLLAQTAFLKMGLDLETMVMAGSNPPTPAAGGPDIQQPLTEGDAIQSVNQQNQVNVHKPV